MYYGLYTSAVRDPVSFRFYRSGPFRVLIKPYWSGLRKDSKKKNWKKIRSVQSRTRLTRLGTYGNYVASNARLAIYYAERRNRVWPRTRGERWYSDGASTRRKTLFGNFPVIGENRFFGKDKNGDYTRMRVIFSPPR